MSYDQAGSVQRETWTWTDATFGGTSVVHNVIGPKGCVGFVRDITVDVTTSLVGTTTVPEIQVGISSGDSTYGRFRLGTTAIAGFATGIRRASQQAGVTGNPPRNSQTFPDQVKLDGYPLTSSGVAGGTFLTTTPAGRIPADTAFTIVAAAGTGGVPAGGGHVRVVIDWIGIPIQ